MIATFDPDKEESNRVKHGVPLLFVLQVFEDQDRVILASFRPIDGEDRYKAIGHVGNRLLDSCLRRTRHHNPIDLGEKEQ